MAGNIKAKPAVVWDFVFPLHLAMSCPESGIFAAPWPIVPLDRWTFATIVLPAHMGYYAISMLVTLPRTRILRMTLLPLCLFLAYRMAMLDFSEGNPARNAENMGLMTWIGVISLRMIVWAFRVKHYTRIGKKRNPTITRTISETMWDAGDLCFNFRGIGWDWSTTNAINVPSNLPTEPYARTLRFLKEAFLTWLRCGLIFEATYYMISPLFDENTDFPLPPSVKPFLQIWLYPISTYAAMEGLSRLYAVIGVVIFRQDPDEWPLLFDAPWRSKSLIELWGARWHQIERDLFTNTGGVALGFLFGRVGYVLGTFATSGLYHDLVMWSLQREKGMCCFLSPLFVLSGMGLVLERVFRKVTGRRVDGLAGVVWVLVWSVGCAIVTMSPECMRLLYQSIEVNWVMRPVYIATSLVSKVV